jgi:hypothetical protein
MYGMELRVMPRVSQIILLLRLLLLMTELRMRGADLRTSSLVSGVELAKPANLL